MVIANSPSLTDIGHQMQFISGAFGHASISVQVLSISITIFALSLILIFSVAIHFLIVKFGAIGRM